MMPDSVSERFLLAHKLASVKQSLAQAITDECFLTRPEWAVRYGERGREFCTADVCFHMEFLAGAIEAGSPEAFADYARLCAMDSRNARQNPTMTSARKWRPLKSSSRLDCLLILPEFQARGR
jgi:hypothetical protein